MITRFLLLAGVFAAFSPVGFASVALKAGKYARVYKGGEGITVTVVPLMPNPEKDALIEVEGIESKIDEIVLRHKAVVGRDTTWVTTIAGEDFWTLRSEKSWGWKRLLLILPERPMEPIDMMYDEKASKSVKAVAFVKRHEKQIKDGSIAKIAAWNRAEREATHNAEFASALAVTNKACGSNLTASINWKTVTDEHLKALSIHSYCSPGLSALADGCSNAETKTKILKAVKSYECQLTTKDLKMKLEEGGKVLWLTHTDASNMDDFANAFVQNQF